MNLQLIRASNGVGEPVQATITALRNIGSTTISVDSLTNWPANFIATTGNKLTNGTLDPSTVIVFSGHTAGSNTIIIDALAPGYADQLSNVGNIVIIKPATLWADNLADTMAVSHNDDGSLKSTAVANAQSDWAPITTVPTLNASNGQREYQLKFAGVDLTTKLQAGTKLKLPRTSTAPTQSMSFVAASSQYATKASPAGVTFTAAYTNEAWIFVNSYGATNQTIISDFNGTTNAWRFILTASTGQLAAYGYNAGAYRGGKTYQSIPLKRWIHVAVTSNMTTGSPTFYIDGVAVPNAADSSGTPPTALVQGNTLQVGATQSTEFFDGYIAEARVWSVVQTQAQIQANKDIALTGAETNLVALFQGNGNFNDKTANANNLTASGGAVATNAANPMNAIEYAIATKVAKVSADTLVTVFTPTGTGIPNETLGTASYSSARTPYGFPAQKAKWTVTSVLATTFTITSSGFNIWQAIPGCQLTAPTGDWDGTIVGTAVQNNSASAGSSFLTTFAPTTNGAAGYDIYANQTENNSASIGNVKAPISLKIPITMTSSGTLTPYMRVNGGGGTVLIGIVNAVFTAECAYL